MYTCFSSYICVSCQMYNEIIAALEQAATDDSVITVVTGTHTHRAVCQVL